MQLKTLVKNSATVALSAGAVALQLGQPNATAALAAVASGAVTFIALPHAIRLSSHIPDVLKSLRDMGSNALESATRKGKALLNKINPSNPDQNVLLGTAAGFATSKVLASTVAPLAGTAIDALADACHLTKATRTFIRHPQLVADVTLTVAGALAGAVCSDSRFKRTVAQTNRTLEAHAASDSTTPSSSENGTASSLCSKFSNAASSAVNAASGVLSPKASSKPKGK
jgi:hypothetical protein